ncbi:alpha/beta-hydrolase [Basidiobolus meristosporus CBS 931.73]|uniref:Alpha/beta-hydrolase n=1 Tax=Basidiobolus meristosporus CBS 931.73 TaxID=1314790 RepID=A0A1Y1XSV3_9FUNG|nr:alpha/beta-hydrolase [Basidiobolus meristosporus CBS 931.73]|eukprot:ORX88576.1 alpha/beta-hydrolase [Basidiobolus meristosporus CBS 931.73]
MLSKSFCLLFLGAAAAFPWSDPSSNSAADAYKAIDSDTLAMLKASARYASVAYCQEDKIMDWSCGHRCTGSLNVTTYFQNSTTEMAGYIGYNEQDKQVVVSYRGTANLENWILDFDFIPKSFVYPKEYPNTRVHRGFYEAANSVSAQVKAGLAKTLSIIGSKSSDYELLVTGHSLGAAVATLGALDIKQIYLNPEHEDSFEPELLSVVDVSRIRLHNYGSPRVGDEAFAKLAYSTITNGEEDYQKLCRVTNQNDIVPRVPPEAFGYLHTPHEIWINYDEVTVDCHDIVNGTFIEDKHCNAGQFPMSPAAHVKYWDIHFGPGCDKLLYFL